MRCTPAMGKLRSQISLPSLLVTTQVSGYAFWVGWGLDSVGTFCLKAAWQHDRLC